MRQIPGYPNGALRRNNPNTIFNFAIDYSADCVEQLGLTRTIKELEDELGARLFVRTTRNTQLTRAGRQLLKSTYLGYLRR